MPGSGGNVVGSGGAARGSWTRHAPVLAAGRVQAGSCGSDKWKKNCLFNLANSGQGPRGSHRCPPASQWSKAHVAGTLPVFPRAPLRQPISLTVTWAGGQSQPHK